jgi:hypothetical protein
MFNHFLYHGLPSACQSISISPVFKSGDKLDPSNYRGIAVMNIFTKLYSIVLNNIIYDYA